MGRVDPLDLVGAPDWIPRFGRWRGATRSRFFETEVAETIRRRRAAVEAGDAPHDLLTLLIKASDPETGLGVPDEQVAAHVVTFIVAGHETTSNALGWTLYLLAKHPDIREKVEAEAQEAHKHPAAEWPERLVWTRAAVEEAMRLYPPASTLSRQALADDRIGDVAIPKGALVIISPYIVHRHKRLWADPDHFRPSGSCQARGGDRPVPVPAFRSGSARLHRPALRHAESRGHPRGDRAEGPARLAGAAGRPPAGADHAAAGPGPFDDPGRTAHRSVSLSSIRGCGGKRRRPRPAPAAGTRRSPPPEAASRGCLANEIADHGDGAGQPKAPSSMGTGRMRWAGGRYGRRP